MRFKHVLVTGGAGYVGAELVPDLIAHGYRVTVLDWFLYEEALFAGADTRILRCIKGDIRDRAAVRAALAGTDAVVHLACISNDPSAALDPELTRSVNQDAFALLLEECVRAEIGRFVFASSSSIYGLSDAPQVREDHPRVPVSAYNVSKAWCEDLLQREYRGRLPFVIVRPATLCGHSRRQRLDLAVNMLAAQTITRRAISVFGGGQYRPNLHLRDCIRLYRFMLEHDGEGILGEAYNASYGNLTIGEIAERIVATLSPVLGEIAVATTPTDDVRSYRVNTDKLAALGFRTERTIEDAAGELLAAFATGALRLPIDAPEYNNVRKMMVTHVR